MPSDGEGAGGSSYVDDRPQSERNSDRKRGDAENSYAHLNAATANESGDPPVDIDPRTGRPREYEISRWGRRVPKSPYPPRFRLSDAMFMRPAPGVQRPVQEVPPGEKDWSKVKYRNLPGIPSGHRWHIRNPETGEVESTSGSIMNDPVKPPLFIPWTVDRLPGRKAPNSDIKAKWNAEAERAKHRHRKDMRATVETENDSSDATPLTPAALRRRSSARFRAQTRAVWKIVPKKATTDNKPVAKKGRDTTTKGPDLASAAAKADSSAGHKDAAGNVTLSIGTREKAIEELLKEITERRGRDQEDWRREREEDQVQRRQEREEDRTDRRRERDEDRKERQEEWKNFREMLERDRERDLEDRREAQKETAELFNKMFEKMGRLNRKPDALGSDGGSTTSVSKNKNFSVSGNGAYQQSPKQATREFNFKKSESAAEKDTDKKSPIVLNLFSGAKWGVSNAGENDKLDVADKSPLVKKPGDWSFKNSEQSVDGGENNMKTDDLDPTEPNRASTTGKKVSFGTDIFGLGDNDETAKTKDGEKNTGKDDNVVGFGSSAFKFDGSESIGKKSGLARRAAEERAGNEEVSFFPFRNCRL